MRHRQLAAAGGHRSHHGERAGLPGTRLAGWGLVLLLFCSAAGAIGLGGAGAAGSLFFGMFIGIGMVAYGIYRRVGGLGPLGPGFLSDRGREDREP
ncbi:hypothetical protein ACX8Z9_13840 [Arthrobacter halodurans]|uniref:Uncharacterized protein n=1 Tax=Arthrobacter halodurans TaxID=516699 RepID=A0ABV4UR21_9MICC